MSYHDFLMRKRITDPMTGLATIPALPDSMFAFQRDITSQSDCGSGINITNYQKLDISTVASSAGVILDESSILKIDGRALSDAADRRVPVRSRSGLPRLQRPRRTTSWSLATMPSSWAS
jgi:hypothetical protein